MTQTPLSGAHRAREGEAEAVCDRAWLVTMKSDLYACPKIGLQLSCNYADNKMWLLPAPAPAPATATERQSIRVAHKAREASPALHPLPLCYRVVHLFFMLLLDV